MAITYAKVVGEISKGLVTIVFNPDATGTDAVNNTSSELIAALPIELVPAELRTPDTDIWYATEKLTGSEPKNIKKVFPMISDEIPEEYYTWMEENGLSRDT